MATSHQRDAARGATVRPAAQDNGHPAGSALALASVTAVLKDVLENGMASEHVTAAVGGDIAVSALPPDRIASGADERAQLNLFLYAVTPNTGLRIARVGAERTGDAVRTTPLALDLHYLVTAYGAQDFHTEILLGHVLRLLQQRPVLQHAEIRASIDALSVGRDGHLVPPALAALAASDLPDRVDRITIAAEFLSIEELSKLWSALQAKFRPSVTYKVSVALIGDGT